MNALLAIWDFVAGRSIVAPAGVAIAFAAAWFGRAFLPEPAVTATFLAILLCTFVGSALERAR
jgi:hypothetical protein